MVSRSRAQTETVKTSGRTMYLHALQAIALQWTGFMEHAPQGAMVTICRDMPESLALDFAALPPMRMPRPKRVALS